MIPLFPMLGRLFGTIWRGLRDPEFRSLFLLVGVTLGSGTWFYAVVEDWDVLDSLYFSVITLTTVGYGDLSPTRPVSKIFTIVYILVGIGILLGFIDKLAKDATQRGLLGNRFKRGASDEEDA